MIQDSLLPFLISHSLYKLAFLESIFKFTGKFEFKPEFTAGNLIQASAALIATGILAAALQKKNANKRREKDILIEDTQSIVKMIDKMIGLDGEASLVDMAGLLKQIQVATSNLKSNLSSLKYSKKIFDFLPNENEIKVIRRLATDTPIEAIENHAKSKRCSAVVRNGIISLTQERRANLENALQAAKRKLQNLRLELNKK